MDLRLREVTWVRLLSLLIWTILMMLKRGITLLIEGIEERVFERSVLSVSERDRNGEVESATLLPPLSDRLVLERIWPLLHRKVNISLLWRLQRVNQAWRGKVAETLEWSALEVVRVDSPGLRLYLERLMERLPPLRERVEDELRAISLLLCESLADFTSQSHSLQARVDSGRRDGGSCSSTGGRVEFRCPCQIIGYPCPERVHYNSESEGEHSEEVELDGSWSSSSVSSLGVYFPRHSVRV